MAKKKVRITKKQENKLTPKQELFCKIYARTGIIKTDVNIYVG
jgi:hypothetical protein